jgi:phage tail tape-measure protein
VNAVWLVWTFGPAVGALVGSVAGALLLAWWQRRRDSTSELSDEDRQAVEATFAAHAGAVATQLAVFADELAEGDPVLRERLRRLEQQMGGGLR